MRTLSVSSVVLTAVIGAIAFGGSASAEVIARDTDVWGVRALGSTVIYGRDSEERRWMRIVDGRRVRADGLGELGFGSLGRDLRGRVVAVQRDGESHVLYDVATERKRRLDVAAPRGCTSVDDVAVWRARTAFSAYCGSTVDVFLREGGRTQRLARIRHDTEGPELLLRGRTLVADGVAHDETHRLWTILDRGRRCFGEAESVDAHGEWTWRAVGVAGADVLWAAGLDEYSDDEYVTAALTVVSTRSAGVCGRGPAQRLVAADISDAPVRSYTLDGRNLFYVTEHAIHRKRLRRSGTTASPPNDDFADAAALAAPGRTTGWVGYATAETGEPDLRGSDRTVWFRFRADRSRRVVLHVTPGFGFRVFAGTVRTQADEVVTAPDHWFEASFDVIAGAEYRIQVASPAGPFATFLPIRVDIRDG